MSRSQLRRYQTTGKSEFPTIRDLLNAKPPGLLRKRPLIFGYHPYLDNKVGMIYPCHEVLDPEPGLKPMPALQAWVISGSEKFVHNSKSVIIEPKVPVNSIVGT